MKEPVFLVMKRFSAEVTKTPTTTALLDMIYIGEISKDFARVFDDYVQIGNREFDFQTGSEP